MTQRLWSERTLWDAGYRLVAGVDEVGRGALAGPLVSAAVIFPCNLCADTVANGLQDVDDSKLLTPKERQRLAPIIFDAAIAVAVGVVAVEEIDAFGIAAANRIAMERAVEQLTVGPEALLLDAAVIDRALPQIGLIDGDACCLSIAAASIVAKVTRDRLMVDYHGVDHRYGFHMHKGYGTAAHITALALHGPCTIHRQSFAPVAHWAAQSPQ
ncbi:MAG: ribonuclease HII [Thermomicrobiales bacterium]